MNNLFDKVNQHFTADEWYQLKRADRADGRKERIRQRTIFVVLGVLLAIFACWMWWGDEDPYGWVGGLWMGVIALLAFRVVITYGDHPEDY
jgi:quinol-cytochrome oxidoreductase complex cytochrome b subunit